MSDLALKQNIKNIPSWKNFHLFLLLTLLFSGKHLNAQENNRPRIVVQSGHHAPICDVIQSNNDEFIFSASLDGTIKMWSSLSRKEIKTFDKHSIKIAATNITVSDDDKLLFSGSADGTLKGWEVANGELFFEAEKQKAGIEAIAIIKQTPLLLVALDNGKVQVWETINQILIQTIQAHKGSISELEVSANGDFFVTAGEDNFIKIWSTTYFEEVASYKKHLGKVNAISIIDTATVVSAGEDGMINFYDINTKKISQKIAVSQQPIEHIVFLDKKNTILGKDRNGASFQVSTQSFKVKKWKKELPNDATITGDFQKWLIGFHKKQLFYQHHFTGNIYYFNSTNIDLAYQHDLKKVALDYSGETLISAGDHFIKYFGEETGRNITTPNPITSMAFSSNGKWIATTDKTSTIIIWDKVSGTKLYELAGHTSRVKSVAFSSDNTSLISGSDDETIIVWNTETGKQKQILNSHSGSVTTLTYSMDNQWIISGDGRGTIKVWDATRYKEISSFQAHNGGIYALNISEDGTTLATGSDDGIIKLWSVKNQKLLHEIKAHRDIIREVDFNLKGDFLVSCGDEIIKVFNVEQGKLIAELAGHTSPVTTVQFSPMGNYIVSGAYDNTILFWETYTWELAIRTYLLGQKDWAVVATRGLFDGSNKGMDAIHFTVKNETIKLQQLKERYYEPALLHKILANEDVASLRNVDALQYLDIFPKVALELDTTNKSPKLYVTLKNQGGGIGKVSVFVNNKEVIEDMRVGQFLRDPEKANFTFPIQRYLAYFTPNKPNIIIIKAYNQDGWLSSPAYEVEFTPSEDLYLVTAKGETTNNNKIILNRLYIPHFYGIIIGTSDYRGDKLDLSFAAKDANDMAAAVESITNNLFGEANVHLKLLTTDATIDSLRPTKENINAIFEKYAAVSTVNDIFFIYLSGHGTNIIVNQKEQFYYLTQEVATGDLSDFNIREEYAISTDEFTTWMKNIPAAKQVMVVDACASGAIADKLYGANKASISSSDRRAFERMKDRTGVLVLAGSAADQSSYEASQFGQGLLTYSLLLGLNGAALRDGGYVDVMELFQFAADKVPEFAQYIGGIQRPVISTPKGGNSFDIGKVTNLTDIPLAEVKPLFMRSNFQNEFTFDDDIGLSSKLNQRLLDIANDSKNSPILYSDAAMLTNAYSIKGRYTIDGEKIEIIGRLFKGKKVVTPFKISGKADDLETTVDMIIEAVQRGL